MTHAHTLTRHRDIQAWVTERRGLPAMVRAPNSFGEMRARLALQVRAGRRVRTGMPAVDQGASPVSWSAWLAELDRQQLALGFRRTATPTMNCRAQNAELSGRFRLFVPGPVAGPFCFGASHVPHFENRRRNPPMGRGPRRPARLVGTAVRHPQPDRAAHRVRPVSAQFRREPGHRPPRRPRSRRLGRMARRAQASRSWRCKVGDRIEGVLDNDFEFVPA